MFKQITALFKSAFGLQHWDDNEEPPPYHQTTTTPTSENVAKNKSNNLTKAISSSDIPQWVWSANQCMQWLFAVLVDRMNISPDEATVLTERLNGCGPNMYLRTNEDWVQLLGEENGFGVYAMLLAVRRSKGAVPKTIKLYHGNP
ncbi:hypothetical protein VTL71DRAFT_7698 [Oculimacula yallundae]|uniref:SAM domain-containing protein n=1 Tax=Oculimacula yallundae TaxID=86028 RepID=A0ABR4BUX6_9HELO